MADMHLLDDLKERGLVVQSTDFDELKEHLSTGMRTVYCGFDPTADSLHVGSLVPLLALRRFQNAGHRPIVLVGGATGMIGDPSFKATERSLQTTDTVQEWTNKLAKQTSRFVNFDNSDNSAIAVNNYDWTKNYDAISFLRDIGKHFSVNMMINRESVKQRIDRDGQGMSFTEFSYTLLQGMDYMELNKLHNCTIQLGGSDQWGNIMSGVDLTRRMNEESVKALTFPLITTADGTKFGKSEGNAIWLDAAKTSPYSFYQFWINTADADVERFLQLFTFLSLEEIKEIAAKHMEEPHFRNGQRKLAQEVTAIVHGKDAVVAAERISEALFSGKLDSLTEEDMAQLKQDGMPSVAVEGSEEGLLNIMVNAGLASSNREARQFITSNAVSVNGEKISDATMNLNRDAALYGKYHILKRGKKNYSLVSHD